MDATAQMPPPPPAGILSLTALPSALTALPSVLFSPLAHPKWLSLVEATFKDPSGTARAWELVERIHSKSARTDQPNPSADENVTDAVDVVAIISPSISPARFPAEATILLVLQFRPPTRKWTLEFPSGLVDAGESPRVAALRELKEETGYVGVISAVGPPIAYEPGITSSCSRMVLVKIDPDAAENETPRPEREADEWSLKTVAVPMAGLLNSLDGLAKDLPELRIDSRLYSFAAGSAHGCMSASADHDGWVRHPSGKYHISKSSPWCYSDSDGYFYFDAFGRVVKQGQQELPPPTGAAANVAPTKTAADAAIAAALGMAAASNIEDGEISDSDRHNHNDRRRRDDHYDDDDRQWSRDHNDAHSASTAGGGGAWQDAAASAQSTADGAAPESDATMKLVVIESKLLEVGSLVLVDASGITVGRDMAFERRLVLKELAVSRTHCTVFVHRVMETIEEEGEKDEDRTDRREASAEPKEERVVSAETGSVTVPTPPDAFADALERAKAIAARLMDAKNSSSAAQQSTDTTSSTGTKRLYSDRASSHSPDAAPRRRHMQQRAVDCFFVADAGSTYGTFVNETRLSKPKTSSQPHRINHGDVLTIGSTKLAAHIHPEWPCDGCRVSSSSTIINTEPRGKPDPASTANSANIAAGPAIGDKKGGKGKTALEAERLQELRRLRREALGGPAPGGAATTGMSGSRGGENENESGGDHDAHMQERPKWGKRQKRGAALAAGYVDRAAMRRQMHGLDMSIVPDSRMDGGGRGGGYNNHGSRRNDTGSQHYRPHDQHEPQHAQQEARTIDTPLTHAEPTNVGSRMLQKMGWTAGQGLGAAGDGRVEPVAVSQRMGRVGLGVQGADGGGFSKPGGKRETLKEATVRRARERFSAMQRGEED
ncbi:nudix hydrolase-like protein [Geranomyces variabilis]|nr:nudix hydrolase-like protein [Geranomyces variabilis]